MRLFTSWRDRVPVKQVGALNADWMVVGMFGAQFSASSGSIAAQGHFLYKPAGEVWK
jgi:hypothetical protein